MLIFSSAVVFPILGLFILCLAKKKEEISTADCIKPCKNVKECTCPALKSEIDDEFALAFCEDGVCSYCARKGAHCAFGLSKNGTSAIWGKYGFIACCEQVEKKEKTPKGELMYKGQDITCRRSTLVGENHQPRCFAPCDTLVETVGCTDKDGYIFDGKGYFLTACSVNGNFKIWKQCAGAKDVNGRICGASGAKCPGEVKECCTPFECKNNECVRECRGKGESCINNGGDPRDYCCKSRPNLACIDSNNKGGKCASKV